MYLFRLFYLIFICLGFLSCDSSEQSSSLQDSPSQKRSVSSQQKKVNVSIKSPTSDTVLNIGKELVLSLSYVSSPPISVEAALNGMQIQSTFNPEDNLVTIGTHQGKIGDNQLQLQMVSEDSATERINFAFKLLSDLTPVRQSYTVVDEYPHNDESFTQGLIYEDEMIIEGSGLEGKSVITYYKPRSGEVLQQAFMPPEYFGEGVTKLGDILYQLTYKSNKIILYNPENLNKIGEKYWPSEGWGVTHDGVQLIISDGSDQLYFVDPGALTEVRRVTVADHTRFYDHLNELEYVEGVVYANVWLTDTIIGIDPQNGKVLSTLDLKNILPGFNSEDQEDYVLNGTAYIPERKSLLVTGKQWPKMFEIQLNPLVPKP